MADTSNIASVDLSRSNSFSLLSRHIVPLDGAKGLAMLLLMFYHFGEYVRVYRIKVDETFLDLIRVGWIGVELFFVLSGFLLTSVLCESKDSRKYFRSFHARRSLRIVPLYYALLFSMLIVLPHFVGAIPSEFQRLQKNQWWFWCFLSNWLFVLEGGFGQTPAGYL